MRKRASGADGFPDDASLRFLLYLRAARGIWDTTRESRRVRASSLAGLGGWLYEFFFFPLFAHVLYSTQHLSIDCGVAFLSKKRV